MTDPVHHGLTTHVPPERRLTPPAVTPEVEVTLELTQESRDLGIYGGIFWREIPLPAGKTRPGHKHQYDHASFLGKGRVQLILTYDGGRKTLRYYDAPCVIEIPAHAYHEIVAVTDAVTFCAFAMRDADGQVADFITQWHLENVHRFTQTDAVPIAPPPARYRYGDKIWPTTDGAPRK